MTKINRPVLRYHGGKWILAPWIISNFPPHKVYVELFGGGGSVLMRKPRSYAEVYNDKWDTVVNVFRVLRDPVKAAELERQIRLTPFSRTEFDNTGNQSIIKQCNEIERARMTIFRSFSGFGSGATRDDYNTGFRANSNRSGTTPAHDWANYPDCISAFTNRLSGVVIENKNYLDIIDQQDSEDTLIYADPPYVIDSRTTGGGVYAYEMTNEDHVQMAIRLNEIKGMCIVSAYETDLYNDLFHGWVKLYKDTYGDGAVKRREVLYMNKSAAARSGVNNRLF